VSLSYTKLVGRDASFQLIRTNPKLTSNVKLSVDSNDEIWLSSIPADPELAKDQYQKYAIDVTKSHEYNVFKFYNGGKTPNTISFKTGSTITKTVTARDLKNQYEFDYYTSGAKYLTSKQFPEKFSYLAPIYLNKVLPDTFFIFKAKGASNYIAGDWIQNQIDKKQFSLDFFKSFQLVKAFDMSPETNIGRYLEAILENPMFPSAPLAMNFNSGINSYSYIRGISINSGTYVQLPVDTNSVFTRGLPILKKEEYIVSRFEANNVIHPNIINLEFLFDDETAGEFEINRYFGFFCNRIELAEFDLDLEAMFNNPNDNDQALEIKYDQTDDIVIPITNSQGVKLRGKGVSQQLEDLALSMTDEKNLFFTYLETKSDIHLVKSGSWNQYNQSVEFRIDDLTLDIGTMFGPGELFSQETARVSQIDSHSTLAVRVDSKPAHVSSLKVYHLTGTRTDQNGKYDELVFVDSTYSTGFVFNAPRVWSVQYAANGQSTIYVSADGTPQDVAAAIVGAINDLRDSEIQAVASSNYAFIQLKAVGESFGQLYVIDNTVGLFPIGTQVGQFTYADGGTTFPHPIISNGQPTAVNLPLIKIADAKDSLLVKTSTNWSRIKRVARVTDGIFPGQIESALEKATTAFLSQGTLIMKDDEQPLIAHSNIEIRNIAKNKVGVLSIFEIKDFDFSINKTEWARFDSLDLFKDFYEPAGIPTLNFRRFTYEVIGTGIVSVNGTKYAVNVEVNYAADPTLSTNSPFIWQDLSGLQTYEVLQGDCILVKTGISPNAYEEAVAALADPSTYADIAIISNQDNELLNYTGQFSLRTQAFNPSNAPTFNYRDKYLQGIVPSEYYINNEQYSTEFAIENKLTPYICKWGLKDSLDCRSNSYRLNTDLAFGKDNFGPSHTEVFASAEKLTHEWFYVESDFGFTSDPQLALRNINYFETPFDLNLFKTDSSYFDEYFSYVPTVDGEQIDRTQVRYSNLIRDPYSGHYETVFKGVKYRFFELDDILVGSGSTPVESIKSTTTRFADYRFSVILKTVSDSYSQAGPPVKYEIIENTNAKAIVVVITLRLAGLNAVSPTVTLLENGSVPYLDKAELMSVSANGQLLFKEVYGDYRLNFNPAGVSNMTYSFLYLAKNKKYNIGDNSFSTIKLAKNIDISFSSFAPTVDGRSTALATNVPANAGYDSLLVSQVAIVPAAYSPIVIETGGATITLSDTTTNLASLTTSISALQEDVITFTDSSMYAVELLISGGTVTTNVAAQLPTGSPLQWKSTAKFYQINGGKDYYENLFQFISFGNFKYLLEDKEQLISWQSYTNGQLAAFQKFTIRPQEPNLVKIKTQIVQNPATVVYTNQTVTGGYTYSEGAQVTQEIHRYSGEYEAVFKPVSAFYQRMQIGAFEIDGANCLLHITAPRAFEIEEFNHVKYATSQILDLENSTQYLPVYPLIDETPIGTAPFNVLASSWDKGYHFEYVNKNTRSQIFGTRRVTEDYSFVSKLANVPDSLFLEEFSIGSVTQAQYKSSNFSNVIDYAEYAKSVRFKIDMATAFAKNFKNAGLLAEFEKFFTDGTNVINQSTQLMGQLTLAEYVEAYAKQNLQRLYKIEEIQVWQRLDKSIPNGEVIIEQKTLNDLVNEGYSQTKSIRINNQNSTLIEGSVDRSINSGLRVSFRIKIKFI